jgi:hypothetical protein
VTAKDTGGTAGGGINASPPQTFTINISPVNDPPSFTKGPNVTVDEDTGPHSVLCVRRTDATPGDTDVQPERLIPFVAAYVDDVDLGARLIRVDWGLDY